MDSSHSTSLRQLGSDFEVFLSFRGTDIRTTFTDYLYNDLIDAGIRTFRDNEELHIGEKIGPELLKAIQSSKVAIPIFSKDYASSKWCMLELVEMLKCKGTRKQIIMPVFYDVGPGVVRHQTGIYEELFEEHANKYDKETLNQWREALYEVGSLKGWELKNIANGHEGSLVKIIVTEVWKELKRNYNMTLSDSLVGIENHVVEMMKLINLDCKDVQIVGIHGMGGIGKSTIAKVIYNDLSKFFGSFCFVNDVREISQRKGLVELQNLLISTILKHKNFSVSTVPHGISVIRDTFCDKKVLIVLDDVDQREQIDALAQNRSWFGPGSRIIVTTRNMGVFYVDQTDGVYQPQELNSDQALQLFCKHAFRDNHPLEPYAELSTKIASTASGLPLALEIFGAFLCGKRKDVWESTWKKLKDIPDDKVRDKLQISYDALNPEQKEIFLDIACLFIGVDKTIASYMWDACNLHPEFNIEVLIYMSLVKIGEDNELEMHDQLKEIGRDIVRKENVLKPEKRSRLWSHRDSLTLLEEHNGTEEVEALYLNFTEEISESNFTDDHFKVLRNLRFLQLNGASLEGDFKGLLSKLKWLEWRKISKMNIFPVNLFLKQLVILDLAFNEFTYDWEGWNILKVAKKLKVIDLSFCRLMTKSPDLSSHVYLEVLLLSGCKSLVEVHESIWNLKNLKRLELSFTSLRAIPPSIGFLEKLEVLDASSSLMGDIPAEIGNLKCLRTLDLSYTEISSLPTCMNLLTRLEVLNLEFADELKSLPELPQSLLYLRVTCLDIRSSVFVKLVNLEKLYIYDCPKLDLQNELCGLVRLKKLKFKSCKGLKCILELPPSLVELTFIKCRNLEEIIGLNNLKLLSYLRFSRCRKLRNDNRFGKLTSLKSLHVKRCHAFEGILDLSNLKDLEFISVTDCPNLAEIHGLNQLQSLMTLDIDDCEMLPNLSILQQVCGLKSLQSYRFVPTDVIDHIEILRILENVEGFGMISGELARPLSDSEEGIEYILSFQRNSLVNFRNKDNNICSGSHYQLKYSDQNGTTLYMLKSNNEVYTGNRELSYSCPGSSCGFLLNYGSKRSHHNSFVDYTRMFADFSDRFDRIVKEHATFELRIKEETVLEKGHASGGIELTVIGIKRTEEVWGCQT